MTSIIQIAIATSSSLIMTKELNPNNDIRTIILIALLNAIVIPLINFIGLKVKKLLTKYGATDSDILMIELESKKAIIKALRKKLEENKDNDLLCMELNRQIDKLDKDITLIRKELDSR